VTYEYGLHDLWSGDLITIPDDLLFYQSPEESISEPANFTFQWGGAPVGWETGPAAAWGTVELNFLGRSAARLLVFINDDVGWQLATPSCELNANTPATAYALFIVDGGVWTTWALGAEITWAPIAER
jgi:hypothetical protein